MALAALPLPSEPEADPSAALTGAQKCAILLLLLEEAQAAELLRRMSAVEVRAVGEAMLTVAEIAPAAVDAVLDEFLARTRGVQALDVQGREARARLSLALGSPRAERVIEEIGPPAAIIRFAQLDWLDAATVAELLAGEHPQAVAVVLAHLPEARAALVLDGLAEAVQADVVQRLATLGPVPPAEIGVLEAALESRLVTLTRAQGSTRLAGAAFTARLVTLSSQQQMLLDALAISDPALAASIAEQSFLFEDLARLAPRELQLVLRELDQAMLVTALKGAAPRLRELVLSAMSSRAADQLRDELAESGPVKKADVAAAQSNVCALVRRLGESGAIMMPGASGYV
ncbi:flagellar motor switch protein FliG [Polymorphobacter sp.]|uniref:flagellar motor switch protein FliG n=1 Tax=Polymorphobacter sp. TaxID=1909290 RepID=UPI003F702677